MRTTTTRWLVCVMLCVSASACGKGDDMDGDEDDTVLGGPYSGATDGGSFRIEYETDPSPIPLSEDFTMRTRVTDPDGRWIEDAELVVLADMPAHGHGMNTTPSTDYDREGWYVTEGMLFHMPGDWRIIIDVNAEGVVETSTLPYGCCFTD